MAKRKTSRPRIRHILGTQGRSAGRPVKRVYPGVTIRIVGSGFGERASRVGVWFDDICIEPFRVPFSAGSILVTAPLPETPTRCVVVTVDGVNSNRRDLRVSRPRGGRREPGSEIAELMHAVDEYAALVGALGNKAGRAVKNPRELKVAVDYLYGCRRINQRNVELLMQWRESQALAAEVGVPQEALRTIERTDEMIRTARLARQVSMLTSAIFNPTGLLGRVAGEQLADWLFGDGDSLIESLTPSFLSELSFSIHEGVKLLEGIENLKKIVVPSVSLDGGGSAGGELTIGVDVSFSWGEGISALAKGVDLISQVFGESGPDITEQVDRLEEKADRQGEQLVMIEEKADRHGEQLGQIEEKGDRQEEKLDRLEKKADGQEEKLDRLEQKADAGEEKLDRLEEKGDKHEEKLDRLEQKADRGEEKLDQLEQKADRQEEKLDRIELKEDKQEEKLDRIEEKADRHEEKLDRLEEKADKAEQKLDQIEQKADQLEQKADRQESKLDLIEGKADRAEGKLDSLEQKADQHEGKLDRLEQKADRQETKLDALEGKADRGEQKLDRLEQKADSHEEKLDRIDGKADRLEQKADRQEGKLDSLEQKADAHETKLDRLEGKADRQEGKLDLIEGKADRQEEKLDRQEEKLDRLVLPVPLEGSIATQQGNGDNLTAVVGATRGIDNAVYLRGAVDIPSAELDEESAWSGWRAFGRPGNALGILEVSLDLEYEEDSNTTLNGLLSVRDQVGNVYHRAFEGRPQDEFLDAGRWTDWQTFLNQP
jgi:predicted  nucleic acid-binding Zn-ribbon protein